MQGYRNNQMAFLGLDIVEVMNIINSRRGCRYTHYTPLATGLSQGVSFTEALAEF